MSTIAADTLSSFVEEAKELLTSVETALIEFENNTTDEINPEIINELFRAVHTIKGGASFLSLLKLRDLAHAMENVFGLIREKKLLPTPNIISTLLCCADACRVAINAPEKSEELETEELLEQLQAIARVTKPKAGIATGGEFSQLILSNGKCFFSLKNQEIEKIRQAELDGSKVFAISFDLITILKNTQKTIEILTNDLAGVGFLLGLALDSEAVPPLGSDFGLDTLPAYALILTKFNLEQLKETFPFFEAKAFEEYSFGSDIEATKTEKHEEEKVLDTDLKEVAVPHAPLPQDNSEHVSHDKTAPVSHDNSIRVSIHVLDKLMALAGELVLTRNHLLQCVTLKNLENIEDAAQRVDLITSEMQDAIMSTRMQSVGIIFEKFKRVVRDLSSKLNKKIKLVLEGQDVDLDRTIIEAVNAPLTHLVRNAIDHGIETPEAREKQGKNPEGILRMSALHKAGQVLIEIADDGNGVDIDKVKLKAVQMGLITQEQAQIMPDEKAIRLIFKPGFSTKDVVTEVSGRGVGIDVVQANISKLGGVTDIISKKGQGTTFRIKLPLTLAIIPSVLVALNSNRFAIPQVNLLELVRIRPNDVIYKIEKIGKATIMRLRGELLPLINLQEVLGLPAKKSSDDLKSEACNIVVVAAGDFKYGIIVDNLLDSAEIVVKPLGSDLGECKIYAGATILGDGHVALILDVLGIADWIRSHDLHVPEKNQEQETIEIEASDTQNILVFENAPGERFAMPLNLVQRIERVQTDKIISVGKRKAIKHQNYTMTVLNIEDVIPVKPIGNHSHYYAIVLKMEGHEIGILASSLFDIVESDAEIDDVSYAQPGIPGSFILGGQVVLLIEPYEIVSRKMPELVEKLFATKENTNKEIAKNVLAVDDSEFFRKQIQHFLKEAGFEVTLAVNGLNAVEILNSSDANFDLVVSDIDMPKLDGYGLAEKIRANPKYAQIPIIALTSKTSQNDIDRGYEVGFSAYLPKLNREQLVESCKALLHEKCQEGALSKHNMMRRAAQEAPNSDYVVFLIGDTKFGLSISTVQEIDRVLPILPVQHAPIYVRGVINLRGEIITVIDLRRKFKLEPLPISKSMRIVLAFGPVERVGLLVDAADDILNADEHLLQPLPSHIEKVVRKCATGVLQTKDSLIVLLDINKILDKNYMDLELDLDENSNHKGETYA